MLLVAAGVLFLVWARSERKGFHLPGGDGTAIALAGGWALLLLVWRLFDKPDAPDPSSDYGIQWGMFAALLAAGALLATGLRVRAVHRPEPPNPAADEPAAGPPRTPAPPRRRADPAAVTEVLGERPDWSGEPPRRRTARGLSEAPTARGGSRTTTSGCSKPRPGPPARPRAPRPRRRARRRSRRAAPRSRGRRAGRRRRTARRPRRPAARGRRTRAPIVLSTLRASACAQTAPNMPVEAPTTATGLPRSGFVACGRDAQSSAFLSTPGIEALYSGVATSTASAPAIASRSARTGVRPAVDVVVGVVGRDRLQPVEQLELGSGRQQLCRRPEQPGVVRVPAQGARDAQDSHRSALQELEVDAERDLVREHEAALGQRRVPVEAELRAVDDRLELEAELRVAERILDRPDDGAVGRDALGVALDREVAGERRTSWPSSVMSVDSKRISGYCSASKNSGDWRCATRFSSFTATVSTGTVPTSRARPASSTVSSASNRSKLPRNVASMCLTAKPAVEWTPSLS